MNFQILERFFARRLHRHPDLASIELLNAKVGDPTNHDHNDVYYTETEVDTLLDGKADDPPINDARYYTETEVDTLLDGKADDPPINDARYYTETEVDTLLAGKSDTGHNHDSRYYTKTQLNNGQLDNRYYTEGETDTLLAGKSDVGHGHPGETIIITNAGVELSSDFNLVTIPQYPSKLSILTAGNVGIPADCILRVYCQFNGVVIPTTGTFPNIGVFFRFAPNGGGDVVNVPFIYATERPVSNALFLYGNYANEFHPSAGTYDFEIYVSRQFAEASQLYCRPDTLSPWEGASIKISVLEGLYIAL